MSKSSAALSFTAAKTHTRVFVNETLWTTIPHYPRLTRRMLFCQSAILTALVQAGPQSCQSGSSCLEGLWSLHSLRLRPFSLFVKVAAVQTAVSSKSSNSPIKSPFPALFPVSPPIPTHKMCTCCRIGVPVGRTCRSARHAPGRVRVSVRCPHSQLPCRLHPNA
jgi:hypothetical protein